ncbi:MBL fold metallo-hydrolase [Brevundimonas goettingensis]|uniref:MBL fold metallo-hydrolase n=1 Tax=Brevundimonas goettingensis TaxID=2774190 RepID=A0A975BZJ5_9CAUL|nr:MBL fold metallo-hydrolase [Brevundimonas goettingensis]QTC90002.1 MBL fold metallo-hydrolase [Brevundimonas goettingensis]
MADGVTSTDVASGPRTERGLTYPLGAPPAPGQAVEAAPGVLWLRLPLPMSLDHINVYALADGDGWTLVDTGLYTKASIAGWEAAFAGPLGGKPVKRVICTHMHPDHLGLAGWLCERFGVPLLMSRLEYVTARMLVADTGPAPPEGETFFRAAGWDDDRIDGWRREFGRFGKGVYPMPQSYQRLSEGDDIEIGGDVWTVVVGNGHCPEHVCLWRKSDDVFLSGDQILPRISSNVSVWPTEPLQNPLGDWMTSLTKLRALLPVGLFVLPSHGEPFTGVHTRLDALTKGHHTGLTRLERALREPRRAIDVFSSLFARPIGDAVFGMATGESVAHLNYLEAQGRARRDRGADGVDWWTATRTDTEIGNDPEEETTA